MYAYSMKFITASLNVFNLFLFTERINRSS
jgi:hypothetical protein